MVSHQTAGLIAEDNFYHNNNEAQEAFEQLRNAITALPILAVPDFSFAIETDTLGKGLGIALMQKGRPLAFWCKALSDMAEKKFIYQRALMAVVLGSLEMVLVLAGKPFYHTHRSMQLDVFDCTKIDE